MLKHSWDLYGERGLNEGLDLFKIVLLFAITSNIQVYFWMIEPHENYYKVNRTSRHVRSNSLKKLNANRQSHTVSFDSDSKCNANNRIYLSVSKNDNDDNDDKPKQKLATENYEWNSDVLSLYLVSLRCCRRRCRCETALRFGEAAGQTYCLAAICDHKNN